MTLTYYNDIIIIIILEHHLAADDLQRKTSNKLPLINNLLIINYQLLKHNRNAVIFLLCI